MRLCLVEDVGVAGLEPLTLTRPAFDLRLGATTLEAKLSRAFGVGPGPARRACVVRPHLAEVRRARDPQTVVNSGDWLAKAPTAVANGRWIPPAEFEVLTLDGFWVGLCEGRPACAMVGPGDASGLEPGRVGLWFEELTGRLPSFDVGGEWIDRPWDLVSKNGSHITRDFLEGGRAGVSNHHLARLALVGPIDRLFIHETAQIDPYTVLDTTSGPVIIGPGAVIRPFTRLEGPCSIGRESVISRADIRGGTTIGPGCRVGGDVESSIFHGQVGYGGGGSLGHSYLGEWVELGSNTSGVDRRTDRGEVSVPLGGDPIATGLDRVGCFVGDHARSGAGGFLNAGTSIGVMCNLMPAGSLVPRHVPSFATAVNGNVTPGLGLEEQFAAVRSAMAQCGHDFSVLERGLYLDLFERTRLERERAYQKVDRRRDEQRPAASAGG
jgi:UDP-N-acetylglucosamine diphosphorylase/glucosamine-1-phosphate N-acetyltransferase